MKQKNFWRKLLSLGLAAAMTVASLTGPGSVTDPAEVKAEGTTQIYRISDVTYNGGVQNPNGTISNVEGITSVSSPGAIISTITLTNGSAEGYQIANDANEYINAGAYLFTITPDGQATTGAAIAVNYRINPVTLDQTNVTTYFTVDESSKKVVTNSPYTIGRGEFETKYSTDDGKTFVDAAPTPGKYGIYVNVIMDGNFEKTYTPIKVGDGEGAAASGDKKPLGTNVMLSGTMKVGQKITAMVEGAPDGVTLNYEFFYEAPKKTIQNSSSNEYTLKAEDVGHKIGVLVSAGDGYTVLEALGNSEVAAADNTGNNNNGSGSTSGGSSTSTPSTTPSTGTTTTTETKPDGTKVETTTETKADGTKVETVTETKKDGSATTTVKETEKNASGKEVAVTTVTEKDASGKVQSETTTSVIAKADTNTSATVTTVKDSKGAVTATAAVTKTGTTDETGKTNGTISAAVVKQITEAAGTSNVEISQTVTNGDKKFTVKANAKDLVSGSKMKIMKLDPKTGEYVLCNKKNYAVNAAGDVNLSVKTEGEFILVNEADAKAASDAILKTVTLKSSSKTVTKGKSTTVAMSSGLNMKNVSKITYTVSNKSVATVSKNGKVTTKKAGTVTVKAKVTLKNGKTKTVTMKIKVK